MVLIMTFDPPVIWLLLWSIIESCNKWRTYFIKRWQQVENYVNQSSINNSSLWSTVCCITDTSTNNCLTTSSDQKSQTVIIIILLQINCNQVVCKYKQHTSCVATYKFCKIWDIIIILYSSIIRSYFKQNLASTSNISYIWTSSSYLLG